MPLEIFGGRPHERKGDLNNDERRSRNDNRVAKRYSPTEFKWVEADEFLLISQLVLGHINFTLTNALRQINPKLNNI
jgi:hypothetical protein